VSDEAQLWAGKAVALLMDHEQSAPGTPLATLLSEATTRRPRPEAAAMFRSYLTDEVGVPPELLRDVIAAMKDKLTLLTAVLQDLKELDEPG
jgi:hypothetical protein